MSNFNNLVPQSACISIFTTIAKIVIENDYLKRGVVISLIEIASSFANRQTPRNDE